LGIEKEEATNSDKYLGKILNNTGKWKETVVRVTVALKSISVCWEAGKVIQLYYVRVMESFVVSEWRLFEVTVEDKTNLNRAESFWGSCQSLNYSRISPTLYNRKVHSSP
jgi:hypothetical protein